MTATARVRWSMDAARNTSCAGDPLLFQFCGAIQEEVHRFAIDYHRKLHSKNSIGSVLDHIEGIGPVKRNALLSSFASVEEIKQADVETLMRVPGHHRKKCAAIREYFG